MHTYSFQTVHTYDSGIRWKIQTDSFLYLCKLICVLVESIITIIIIYFSDILVLSRATRAGI